MDKKSKKKGVGKRKSDETAEGDNSKKKIMVRKNESEKEKVEIVNQVVEVPVEQGQQIVHAGQIVEGNFEQPVRNIYWYYLQFFTYIYLLTTKIKFNNLDHIVMTKTDCILYFLGVCLFMALS